MRQLCIIAFGLLAATTSWAEDTKPERQVRVWVQHIALPHSALTELLAKDGNGELDLHTAVTKLQQKGEAKLLETSMVCGSNREKVINESIREEIFPTEYDPPGLMGNMQHEHMTFGYDMHPQSPRFINATAFETRNTGVTLEVEPVIKGNSHVSLRIVPELVQNMRIVSHFDLEDAWGKISASFPIYETWRCNVSTTLKCGSFTPLCVITPKIQSATPFEDTRVVIFARADIISLEP